MTSPVPGFDDRLSEFLTAGADAAGEDVNTYVGRAVAARLVADATRDGAVDLESLLARIANAGLAEPAATAAGDDGASDRAAVINDPERLRALFATGLLDNPSDAAYDQIVTLAVEALSVPGAAVSLVDRERQFFSSALGLPDEVAAAREAPLERSLCQYAVASGDPLIIEDIRTDPMLHEHPIAAEGGLVSYAGVPLVDGGGHAVGVLCVWDTEPRQWSTGHVQVLEDLAAIVRDRMFSVETAPGG